MIDDQRSDSRAPLLGYVVATCDQLSGSPTCPNGRYIFALAVNTEEELDTVWWVLHFRDDMQRVRHCGQCRPSSGLPWVKFTKQDVLSVQDRATAESIYLGKVEA